jgi:hypothetical protein
MSDSDKKKAAKSQDQEKPQSEESSRHVWQLFAKQTEPDSQAIDDVMRKAGCDSQCQIVCKTAAKSQGCNGTCKLSPSSECGTCLSVCQGGTCKTDCMHSCQSPTCKIKCQFASG